MYGKDHFITVDDIVRTTGLLETKIQDWLTLYDDFFVKRQIDGSVRYEADSSIRSIMLILVLTLKHLSSEKIRELLSQSQEEPKSQKKNEVSVAEESPDKQQIKELQDRIVALEQAQQDVNEAIDRHMDERETKLMETVKGIIGEKKNKSWWSLLRGK